MCNRNENYIRPKSTDGLNTVIDKRSTSAQGETYFHIWKMVTAAKKSAAPSSKRVNPGSI
jgi:hypothetical protein